MELSFASSIRYNFFENEDVAMIDKAVIEKPVDIDKKAEIVSNAPSLSKFSFVDSNNKVKPETIINMMYLIIFIFDFGY